jgi:hypothetical protein
MLKSWLWVSCSLGFLLASGRAHAGDACTEAASAFANGPKGAQYGRAELVSGDGKLTPIALKKPCHGDACELAYFSSGKPPTPVPSEYVPLESYRTATSFSWQDVAPRPKDCKLALAVFAPKGAVVLMPPKPPPSPDAGDALFRNEPPKRVAGAGVSPSDDSRFLAESLADYQTLRRRRLSGKEPGTATGTAQGLEAAATETLQILGQIVVDRASAEAYRLIALRLRAALACDELAPPVLVKGKLPKPSFPKTCGLLGALRIEDLATSRDALLGALLHDATSYLGDVQESLTEEQIRAEQVGALGVVGAAVAGLLVRPKLPAESPQARAVLGALLSYVDTHFPSGSDAGSFKSQAERALAAGVLSYVRCDYEAAENKTKLSECAFTTYADAYAGELAATRTAARSLAAELLAAATLVDAQNAPDAASRVTHAVDAVLAASCMLLNHPDSPELACPEPARLDPKRLDMLTVLALLKPIVDGALDKDSNVVIGSVARALSLYADAEYQKKRARAFLLLGSLVQYSASYAGQSTDDAAERHEQRTKILESLTEAMSDRTARDGDDIWSFGGSFRGVAGARFGAKRPALLSPLGLPLGVAFDHVSEGSSGSFHFELSPFDLGQYVAFDDRGVVRTPKFADAVSPSVTVGVGWGRSLPLVLGATCGYSPAFELAPAKPGEKAERGSVNAGVTLGVYVPLVDLN